MSANRPFCVLLAVVFACAAGAQSVNDRLTAATRFDLPAQALRISLQQLANQAGIQILFEEGAVEGLYAPALQARQSTLEALNILLKGTALEYTARGETVAIRRKSAASNARSAAAAPSADDQQRAAASVRQTPAESGNSYAPLAAKDTDAKALEEVLVTASKRFERLQDAPVAISVLDARTLDQMGVQSFQDYASLVPNLAQTTGTAPGVGTVVLRGLYTGAQSATNTTSFYFDETPSTPNGAFAYGTLLTPDPDLTDVDHIEVLKGPQGTLYGAASLGGLIRIIPKRPDVNASEPTASLRVGASAAGDADSGYGFRGSALMPLIPGLMAIEVSAFNRQDPGYIKNVTTGSSELGRTNSSGGMIALELHATDSLRLTLRALNQDRETRGLDYQDNIAGTGQPLYGEREYASFIDQGTRLNYRLYEAVGEYAGSLGLFTAVASEVRSEIDVQTDYTSSYGVVLAQTAANGSNVRGDINPASELKNLELRFAGRRLGRFEYLLGAFRTHQDNLNAVGLFGETAQATPLAPPFGNLLSDQSRSVYEETAYFGNATYYFTDQIDLTAGIRRTHDAQRATTTSAGYLGTGITSLASEDGSTLFQYTARWRPADTLSLYARAASGYRPGGPQTNLLATVHTYDPDTVWDYEVGAKGSLLDRRLSFDTAIYYIDWKNVQLSGLVQGFSVVTNGGAAAVKGVEFQSNYATEFGLTLGGALGFNDARLTSLNAAAAAVVGARNGDRLPGSPRWTLAVFGDEVFPLGDRLQGWVGATVKYQGDKLSSFSQDPLNVAYEIPSYTVVDVRAGLNWGNYSLRAAINNLAGANGYTGYSTNRILASQDIPSTVFLIAPRTYSLTLGAKF